MRSLTSYVARLLLRFPLFSLLSLDSSFDSYIYVYVYYVCVYTLFERKKISFPVFTGKLYNGFVANFEIFLLPRYWTVS